MTDQMRAPWTPEQVAALNHFQAEGGMHPFTCGGEHAPGSPALIAYTDGWRCSQPYGESCDYRQDWAHAFMADPNAWPKPFADLRKAAATEATEPATVTDPEWLRQQYAAAVQPLLMDVLPKPIAAARAWEIVDTILFVRDWHLAQLRQRLELAAADLGDRAAADGAARTTPDNGAASGDTADNCSVCGGGPVVYRSYRGQPLCGSCIGCQCGENPCVRTGINDPAVSGEAALRAAHIRDQAALTQIRLHIAVHRQRLRLADPVLLAKVDAVLREVGELETARGGGAAERA
ncbi:hypothetical protein ACFXI6_14425 [Streptomyces mirabilis]|uniref:hypothetical protein n=1 Tax=Streptomyces mirabilis TaxID=68239 RepID=UPI003681F1C1